MVSITRLNGTSLVLNALLIETIESTPDTMITLTNGKKFIAKESMDVVQQRINDFYRQIQVIKMIDWG